MDMDRPNLELHADARFALAYADAGGIQVNRASRIMTASTHAAYLSASELLTHARRLADETIARSQAGYEEACERGYEAGQAKARQQAVHDQVRDNLDRHNGLENLEADLNALVLQALRRLLGEMDCAERVGMLIREGLTRIGRQQGAISIHVHPELRERIASHMTHWQMAHPCISLEIVANAEIGLEACRIVSRSGQVDGDLRLQLEALETALCARPGACPEDGLPPC
jgi:type III secretion system HrpE/YscL family protein